MINVRDKYESSRLWRNSFGEKNEGENCAEHFFEDQQRIQKVLRDRFPQTQGYLLYSVSYFSQKCPKQTKIQGLPHSHHNHLLNMHPMNLVTFPFHLPLCIFVLNLDFETYFTPWQACPTPLTTGTFLPVLSVC